MICVAALIVFGIMAIFSATYRPLAKEAFSCVFRKVTLRKCQTGLDSRFRMAVMMPFIKRTPRFARWIHKHFSVLSAIFVIITLVSFGYVAYGGYNYVLYGNCNGPGNNGFCIFDPSGPGSSATGECTDIAQAPEALIKPLPENLTAMKTFHENANFTVIFFGCYACPYTRQAAAPLLQVIAERPDVKFVLIDFPIEGHAGSFEAATAGDCVYDENKNDYLPYAEQLFTANLSTMPSYNNPSFAACIEQQHPRVTAGIALGLQTGVYGTPTYFIGNKAVVGPLNKRALNKLINDEMKK